MIINLKCCVDILTPHEGFLSTRSEKSMTFSSLRITCVQSGPGVTMATPQQGMQPPGPAYLPSTLTTLGFTTIAPAGQTLVQPIVGQPPLLAQAPPLSCQSQTPPGQTAATTARQVE